MYRSELRLLYLVFKVLSYPFVENFRRKREYKTVPWVFEIQGLFCLVKAAICKALLSERSTDIKVALEIDERRY